MFLVRALTGKKQDSEHSLEESEGEEIEFTKIPILKCDVVVSPPENFPRHDLDDTQTAMINDMRSFIDECIIEDTPENQTQRQKEVKWLSDACLVRYLRATKFNLEDSSTLSI